MAYDYTLLFADNSGILSTVTDMYPNQSSQVLSVFCSDYDLIRGSGIYGSNPDADDPATYLIWTRQSLSEYDWSYNTVYERGNYKLTSPETVVLTAGTTYEIQINAKGGSARSLSHNGSTNWIKIAGGGGAGGAKFRITPSQNISVKTETNSLSVLDPHGSPVISVSVTDGEEAPHSDQGGKGGKCVWWQSDSASTFAAVQWIDRDDGKKGGTEYGRHSNFSYRSAKGGKSGSSSDIVFDLPPVVAHIYMDQVVPYLQRALEIRPSAKPTWGHSLYKNRYGVEMYNLSLVMKDFKSFIGSAQAQTVKVPEDSDTYKYLGWTTLADA